MNYMPMNMTPQWFIMANNLVETQKNKEYITEDEQILESLNWD